MSEAAPTLTMRPALACFVAWVLAAASAARIGVWPAIGGVAVALGLAVLVLDRPATARMLEPSPRLVLAGVFAGGSMAAATYLVFPALARITPLVAADTSALYATFRAPPATVTLIALAPIVIGEELVWRGVVQGVLARRLGPRRAVGLAALAYSLAHAPVGSPVLAGVALLCGLAWGTLRAASASLVPAVVAHLVWDAVVLLWLPLFSS